MPNFTFTARDSYGEYHNGTQAAETTGALASALRARNLSLIKAKVTNDAASSGKATTERPRRRGILSPNSFDVEFGLRMLANMLDGGLTLMSALKTVSEQVRRPKMGIIWDDVHDRVAGGMPFADALERHKVFPTLVIQLARAGEISGTLEVVLDQAADHLERKRNLMITVFSAMMYPAFTTVVALGVGAFLMLKVIPEISMFLSASGKKLPAITQALMDTSKFLNTYVVHISIISVTIVVGVVLLRGFPPGARLIDKVLLKVPVIGTLLRLGGTTLFARGLGMLLDAGVPVIGALETAGALMKNAAIAGRVADARRSVLSGNSLAKPLASGGEFMPMLPRMVAVGEETGTMSNVLIKVANFYEKQLEAYVKRMTMLIEPIMTVVVGVMVGFVYLAFFMAVYSI